MQKLAFPRTTAYLFGILFALCHHHQRVYGQSEKVVVMLPADCLLFSNCLASATVTVINSTVLKFDVQTTTHASQTLSPTYVAIGLSIDSRDSRVEDDALVQCGLSNQEIDVFMSNTGQGPSGAERHENNDGISVTHRSYTHGVIHCVFEWQRFTVINNKIFDMNQLSYDLLLAVGNEVDGQHTNHTKSTVPFIDGSEIAEEPTGDIDYDRCGTTQSCFGIPTGCLEGQNCHTAVAISFTSPTYLFQLMTSLGTRYVSVALSDDRLMADDSVIECVYENSVVNMYTSYNRVDYTGTDRHPADGIAVLLNSSYINGKINCYVEQNNFYIINERVFDLDNQRFYIMIAIGDDVTATEILLHTERETSSQAILMQEIVRLSRGGRPILVALHGCFMIVAWMGTAAIGLVLARHYKSEWGGKRVFGKDIWLAGHMACMIATWILTLVAFVLIFIHVRGWTRIGQFHGIIGTIVTGLCFFQPIGAVFRPGPNNKNRYMFNVGHHFIGRITFLLAIVTIFSAIFISSAEMPIWFIAVMVLFAVFFWGSHILMGIMIYLLDNERGFFPLLQSMASPAKRVIYEKHKHYAWYIRVKVKIFFIYSAVITAFVITGILVVLLYRK